jgi:uncharacterized protein YidB (DUF937 family)
VYKKESHFSPKEIVMGLFDQLKDTLMDQLLGEKNSNLMESVLGVINNPQMGGLAGLIKGFQDKGLGDLVSSWVSTGQNLPISAQQIQSVLGNEQLQGIAAKLGISLDETSNGLASLLPQMIDKLTPEGNVPDNDILEQGLGILKGKLAGQ